MFGIYMLWGIHVVACACGVYMLQGVHVVGCELCDAQARWTRVGVRGKVKAGLGLPPPPPHGSTEHSPSC